MCSAGFKLQVPGRQSGIRYELNGLDSDKTYEIYDYDKPDAKQTFTGRQLMTDGVKITINETPKAVIILYKAV